MIHPSDGELATYFIEESRTSSVDAHVNQCADCRDAVDDHRKFDDLLRGAEPWRVASPTTDSHRNSLRAMARQTQREDEEADVLLAPLLAAPQIAAWEGLVGKKEFRTAGVVRRLCETAHDVCPRLPPEAVKISRVAILISEALPDDLYPAGAVSALRGLAWKELTNGFRFLDRFDEALDALSHAEEHYRQLAEPELDLAIIEIVRAFVLLEIEDYVAADKCAIRALEIFRHLGQDSRSLHVMTVQATIVRQRKLPLAIEMHSRVLARAEAGADVMWKSIAASNLAWCYLEYGDPVTAKELFRAAKVGCDELGFESDATRCDWGVALAKRDLGNHREALTELVAVSNAFGRQQVVVDSATAMVEAFEIMLALGEHEPIERLATGLVTALTRAGRTESALSALAYIKEAASRKSVTPEILSAARAFLLRADRHHGSIFAPPPFS
jgi:tetratricopeptide (TPR) repeat protein